MVVDCVQESSLQKITHAGVITVVIQQELSSLPEHTNLDSATNVLQRQLALFHLKLQGKHIFGRAVQLTVINELELLFSHFHQTYQTLPATCLENVNMDINNNSQLALLREICLVEH